MQHYKKKFIGVRRNIANSETTWERLEGGIGKTANAVTSIDNIDSTLNDFDNIYPWSDIRTCSLNKDGSVNKYYNEPDFKWTDNYIMTEVPEFYWNREQKVEDGVTWEYIYISQRQTELTPNKSEKFYIGRYTATGSSSDVTTRSAKGNLVNISITELRAAAKNIGENWGLIDIWRWSYLQMLYLVEYADYNCQKKVGNGTCVSDNPLTTGKLNDFLMKSGCKNINSVNGAVIYRGIENLWGNINQLLDGINLQKQYSYVCNDREAYTSNKFVSPYIKLSYEEDIGYGDYIKTIGYDENNPAIQRAIAVGGSSSTYVPDAFSSYASTVYVGGGIFVGKDGTGLWCAGDIDSSQANSLNGSRLLYIPPEN